MDGELRLQVTDMGVSQSWTDALFMKVYASRREQVFRAWTDYAAVARWWGPYGFHNPVCRWNAVPHGNIYIAMTAPDGMMFPLTGYFHEVAAPEQLIFSTFAFADENGRAQLEVLASVILIEEEGGTRVIVEATVMRSTPEVYCFLNTMYEGWKQSLDKLEHYLNPPFHLTKTSK